jgi:RNA polymerase sigma factor (sigma-70 family)
MQCRRLWQSLVKCLPGLASQHFRHGDLSRGAGQQRAAAESLALRAAVAARPDRQRVVLFFRHYADLDYDTIAAALGIRRGTVAATLHTAHSALRRAITEVTR